MALKSNMLSGGVLGLGGIIINLISYPIFLKYIGAEAFGLWATLSIIITFIDFGNIGIDRAVIKFTAEAHGMGNVAEIRGVFSNAVVVILAAGSMLLILAVALRLQLIAVLRMPARYHNLANLLIPLIALLSMLVQFDQVVGGVLWGIGRVDLANYFFLGGRALSILATFALLKQGQGIWSLFWGRLLSHVVYAIVAYCVVALRLKCFVFSVQLLSWRRLGKLLRFGGLLAASSLVSMLMIPLNKAVLARYVGLAEVAYLEIANSAVLQARSIFLMSNSAIMPEISSISAAAKNKGQELNRVMRKSELLVLCLGIPVFLALYLLAPIVLPLWLRDEYVNSICTAFRIILIGYSLNVVIIPMYFYFMGVGKVYLCFSNHLAQSALNMVFVVILIAAGAVTFTHLVRVYSVSVFLSALMLLVLYLKHRGFRVGAVYERYEGSGIHKVITHVYKIFSRGERQK